MTNLSIDSRRKIRRNFSAGRMRSTQPKKGENQRETQLGSKFISLILRS